MAKLAQQSVVSMVASEGLKMTPQRRAIVDYLESAEHHPTADEILNAVNDQFPMTSRATVYNTLNWLKESGLVREVHEGGVVRFDPNTDEHHHFICRVCGGVEDVAGELVGDVRVELAGGRVVENFEVTLRGVCVSCQKKSKKAARK